MLDYNKLVYKITHRSKYAQITKKVQQLLPVLHQSRATSFGGYRSTMPTSPSIRKRPISMGKVRTYTSQSKDASPTPLNINKSMQSRFPDKFEELPKPANPRTVLQQFSKLLTQQEQTEIEQFSEIYYIPSNRSFEYQYIGNSEISQDYHLVFGEHIVYRFEILQIIGKGEFSQVCRCFDHKNNIMVAVKIAKSGAEFTQIAENEINMLKIIKERDLDSSSNIIRLKEHFLFRGHLCLILELLGPNLYTVIKQTNYTGIPLTIIKRFAIQALNSLRLLRKIHIIHSDIRPENFCVISNANSQIKLLDFGTACFEENRLSQYVQSRYYRAPEVIVGLPYSSAIDMWSLGCVLCELVTGRPAFPGEDEAEVLLNIIKTIGLPPSQFQNAPNSKIFFDRRGMPRIRGAKPVKITVVPISEMLSGNEIHFIDFVQSKRYLECLQWDPHKRFRPDEALKHDWVVLGANSKQQF